MGQEQQHPNSSTINQESSESLDDEIENNENDSIFNSLLTPPQTVNPNISRAAASSLPRPRRTRAPVRRVPLEEPPRSPSYQVIFAIILKYFRKNAISKTISNRLDALAVNEIMYMNTIMNIASTATRPSPDELTLMIEELNQTNILNISALSHRRVSITKIAHNN